MHFGHLPPAHFPAIFKTTMSATTQKTDGTNVTHALVQLLRGRSYEEIRARMYDNSLGTAWWSACKTELDIRNGERMATAIADTSHILDKMRNSTEHLDGLTDKLVQATTEMADLLRGTKQSARRMEIATYIIVAVTILQLFYAVFHVFGKR